MTELAAGDSFGRYTIVRPIGEGGMARVFAARDGAHEVALKIIRPELMLTDADGKGDEAGLRLLREGRAAAQLNHPNAVEIYEVGENDGRPFVAMELLDGRTLKSFVGDVAISIERKIAWLADVARVLAAAHAMGLVHRDVKPENVMICADGRVKVLDFGIVKRLTRSSSASTPVSLVTRDGFVMGTPLYMSPEQVMGEPVDGRSDQFSWATVAYELLTGKHPVDVHNPKALPVPFAILQQPAKPLREVLGDVPPSVETAVMRALAKLKDERFDSMDEIVRTLDPFVVRSRPPPPVEPKHPSAPARFPPPAPMPFAASGPAPSSRPMVPEPPGSLPILVGARGARRRRTPWLATALAVLALVLALLGIAIWSGLRLGTLSRARTTRYACAMRRDRIVAALEGALHPSLLEVIDESDGHNVPKGSESHFRVRVVSAAFSGMGKVKRHQAVYAALQNELDGGLHALAITAETPEEHASSTRTPESPPCRGGSST